MIAWDAIGPLLGTAADTDLAQRFGVTPDTIARRRKTLGIAAYVPVRVCRICGKPRAHKVGLCHTHGERWRRAGKPPIDEWIAAFIAGALNTCAVCGRQWNGYHGSATCSTECDEDRRRRVALARWHAKSEAEKRAATQRDKVRRQARKTTIVCLICGTEFIGLPHRRFCSEACRRRQATEINRANRRLQYRLRFERQLKDAAKIQEEHPCPDKR